MAWAKATKRRKFTSARVTPSGFKRPVEAIPRPRPHMTFSLNSGNTAAPSRSKTTSRSEFEPRSITPMRSATNGSRSYIRSADNKTRVPSPQRLTSSGQARTRHKVISGTRAVTIEHALVAPGRRQTPALQRITEVRHHDFVQHLAVHSRVFNRHQCLDAAVEIARHPIGRTDEHLGSIRGQFVAVAKAHDAAMLEKPPDDALDADVLRKARKRGPAKTDTAYHQIDAHPRLRGFVEKIDYGRVDERVQFRPDLCR